MSTIDIPKVYDKHNRKPRYKIEPSTEEKVGTICILLRNGSLIGPFSSRSEALYWCSSQELDGFSTYDLITPNKFMGV